MIPELMPELIRSKIESDLHTLAARAEEPLRDVVQYALLGGKRARGVLLVAAGEGVGIAEATLVRAAACVELLHAATLVQDDIFDRSHTRRGRPAVYRAFGPQLATLASDWMLSQAMRAAFRLHPDLGEALSACAQRMMAGEAREATPCHTRTLPGLRAHALAVARGKTGELFGLSVSAPLLLVGQPVRAERLRDCGCELGVAFQYLDDTLDLYGNETCAGKDLHRDLSARLYTRPVLDAAHLLPPSASLALLEGEAAFSACLIDALQACAAREWVRACAREQWNAAVAQLTRELPKAGLVPAMLHALARSMLPAELPKIVRSAA